MHLIGSQDMHLMPEIWASWGEYSLARGVLTQ